ncbi:MAG: alpha/beta fold hydrolase [Candidatus Microthrix sp.]|uniref:alpha/beta fold hydrolase n=1 Tax=Candidatus Neomicrothrix sp. TaxID=2719034 RepID=UPI0025BEBD75|nr:alpha/beta fold hydrolase [Candidatus Microthrix sp.]MBL0205803.1 alpha/beta fold hydrolase [Candidatus Microthrix sp.]
MALTSYRNDGLTFEVDDSGGDGEVVVLLHGFRSHVPSWSKLTPHLVQAGYRVLAPDQRGYSPGARPKRRRDYAIDLLVADIVALADNAGARRFHVVGHDWGGGAAWALAERHPERLLSMTSLSTPHPRAMVAAMVRSNQALKSWYMLAFQLPWLPEAAISSKRGGTRVRQALIDAGMAPAEAESRLDMLRGGAARGALGWYRALPFAGKPAGGKIRVPTLYIYSTDDVALGGKAADLTGSYVSGPYTYEVLDGVNHWIPDVAADTIAPMILDHLA